MEFSRLFVSSKLVQAFMVKIVYLLIHRLTLANKQVHSVTQRSFTSKVMSIQSET